MRRGLALVAFAIAALIALALILVTLVGGDPEKTGLDGDMLIRLFIGLGMVVLIAGGALSSYRGRGGEALGHAALWLAIIVALVGGYSYRFELSAFRDRVMGELLPGSAVSSGDGSVTITRQGDDSFLIDALVNGRQIRFIFDTGADSVALTAETAAALGLSIQDNDYTRTVFTANGPTQTAPVRLAEVRIGSIRVSNVEASVAKPGALPVNLLGMSFLSRLGSYTVSGDRLTLRAR